MRNHVERRQQKPEQLAAPAPPPRTPPEPHTEVLTPHPTKASGPCRRAQGCAGLATSLHLPATQPEPRRAPRLSVPPTCLPPWPTAFSLICPSTPACPPASDPRAAPRLPTRRSRTPTPGLHPDSPHGSPAPRLQPAGLPSCTPTPHTVVLHPDPRSARSRGSRPALGPSAPGNRPDPARGLDSAERGGGGAPRQPRARHLAAPRRPRCGLPHGRGKGTGQGRRASSGSRQPPRELPPRPPRRRLRGFQDGRGGGARASNHFRFRRGRPGRCGRHSRCSDGNAPATHAQ